MRGLGSGHVTCGPMRGLEKKLHGEGTDTQTDRQTNKHTDGHRDSMTESAQWADSVKSRCSEFDHMIHYITAWSIIIQFTLTWSCLGFKKVQ